MGRGPFSAGEMWTTDDSVEAIYQASDKHQVPAALMGAVAKFESGFRPDAIGDSGWSYGIFQLYTGGGVGNMCGVGYDQLLNPYVNADCAGWYMRSRYDATGDWYEAIRAWSVRDAAWALYQDPSWQEQWGEYVPGPAPGPTPAPAPVGAEAGMVLVGLGLLAWWVLG